MSDEIISPLYDFAFAQIFGSKRNIDNTRAFLKTLLDIPEGDYDRLTVENPVLKRFFRYDKMGVVDLKLSTKSGRIIHIELQVKKRADLKSRITYYTSRLIGDQLQWGQDYNKVHQVISIIICDHVLIDDEPSYINRYELRDGKGRRFTDLLQIVILELPKLPKEEDSGLWPWLRFFTCTRKEEYEMLAKKHPELEKAVCCVRKMSLIGKWRYYQFHKQLYKVDEKMLQLQIRMDAHAEGLAEGRTEGLAEGRTEGLAEGKLEVARKMKHAGRPLSEIVEFTGLPAETVKNLQADL